MGNPEETQRPAPMIKHKEDAGGRVNSMTTLCEKAYADGSGEITPYASRS